jgi:hypothetical protein
VRNENNPGRFQKRGFIAFLKLIERAMVVLSRCNDDSGKRFLSIFYAAIVNS